MSFSMWAARRRAARWIGEEDEAQRALDEKYPPHLWRTHYVGDQCPGQHADDAERYGLLPDLPLNQSEEAPPEVGTTGEESGAEQDIPTGKPWWLGKL